MRRFVYRWLLTLAVLTLIFNGGITKLRAQGRMGPQMRGGMMQPRNFMGNGFQMEMQGMRLGSGMITNPYQSYGGMMNGRGMGNGGSGTGGSGNGGSGDYGSNNGAAGSQDYSLASAYSTGGAQECTHNILLDAMGLPNKNDKLTWPLGLQALLPDLEVSALRNRIDAVVQVLATQDLNDHLTGRLVDGGKQSVSRLRLLLRTNGADKFDTSVYKEAAQFLNQLEDGLDLLR